MNDERLNCAICGTDTCYERHDPATQPPEADQCRECGLFVCPDCVWLNDDSGSVCKDCSPDTKRMDADVDDMITRILSEEKVWRETVKPGDMVDATRDQTFLSTGERFIKEGKLYEVKEVYSRPDTNSYGVKVEGDVPGEPLAYISWGKVIIRDGVIIWSYYEGLLEADKRSEFPAIAERGKLVLGSARTLVRFIDRLASESDAGAATLDGTEPEVEAARRATQWDSQTAAPPE